MTPPPLAWEYQNATVTSSAKRLQSQAPTQIRTGASLTERASTAKNTAIMTSDVVWTAVLQTHNWFIGFLALSVPGSRPREYSGAAVLRPSRARRVAREAPCPPARPPAAAARS